jgi:hypothetical protein
LDTYIAKFKQLVAKAELDINSHGVMEIFKQGLKSALVQNVLNAADYDPNVTYTFAQMELRVRNSHLRWVNSLAYKKGEQRQQFYQKLGLKPRGGQPFRGGRRTTSQGGDAMDVDTMNVDATTFKQLSEEEKKKLMANNACFYCQKVGHRAKDCRKKSYDRRQAGGSGGNQRRTEVKTTDLIDFSTIPKEQVTDHLANFLQSDTFMEMEDDQKLDIVAKIAPKGF